MAGLGVAAVAVVAGLVDYSRLPRNHPAFRTATAHMLAMSVSVLCFLASALLREGPERAPDPAALVCSGLGFFALLVGGWLGGTLIYRFGVAVEPVED